MAAKKDFTQVAHAVFIQATGAAPKPKPPTAKQIAGSKGGKLGGKVRMGAMTVEQHVHAACSGFAGPTDNRVA